MRFQAYAKVHKFKETIGDKPESYLPRTDSVVLDPTKEAHKPRTEAKKRNELAITCLIVAFINEEQLGLIYEASTDEYLDGLAFLVIWQLLQKFGNFCKNTNHRIQFSE